MSIPNIYTTTPIEAHIIAICLKVQTAIANVFVGYSTLKALFIVCLAITALIAVYRAINAHDNIAVFTKIIIHLFLIGTATTFISSSTKSVSFHSYSGPWGSKSKIASSSVYAPTLGQSNEGLAWYVTIAGAFNQIADLITDTIAKAVDDQSLKSDPTFLMRQLARTSSSALSPTAAAKFEALLQRCSDTKSGKILQTYSSVKELFNLSTQECADLWQDFDTEITAFRNKAVQELETNTSMLNMAAATTGPAGSLASLSLKSKESFINQFTKVFGGNDAKKTIANKITASALSNYANRKAGFTSPMNITDVDTTHNDAATFSGLGDQAAERWGEGILSSAAVSAADRISRLWGGNARAAAMKADAAIKFNQFSSLISTARGMIHGVLAILFVLASITLGFGITKFFKAWLLALATICFYKPVAVLGYAITAYYTKNVELLKAMDNIGNDPLLIGGLRIIEDHIVKMQTTYLYFEIGTFATFLVGAIAMFKPISSASSMLGHRIAANAGQLLMTAVHQLRYLGGSAAGAAGRELTMNLNHNGNSIGGIGVESGTVRSWGAIQGSIGPATEPPGWSNEDGKKREIT